MYCLRETVRKAVGCKVERKGVELVKSFMEKL